ncbi:MAG: TonB-dependent receptor, partial [Muribaculaceae bacterium]|nr:TonB-dependent receptor [Muribaculaceae bacterium]
MVGVLPSVQVHAATAAQSASSPNCKGKVVDELGQPIPGVAILAPDGTPLGTTDVSGLFNIKLPANVKVINLNFTGYKNFITDANGELGVIELVPDKPADDYYGDIDDLIFEESVLDDDEGGSQNVAALTGSNDNIFYNTASYNFGPMYYRFRGLENQYQTVYINGLRFNDLIRGSFSFSTLLGMTSRAFRNKTTAVGLEAANYGFGGMAGSVNYNTVTDLYAPGFNGSLAYTNSNYMLRAMATYSTGLNRQGWAFTVSAIGRYANEGIMEGTFYNSAGLFLSVEKKFNAENSLTLTAFGGPTQRATGRPTYQEAYDLAGTNLYNPDWGWQDGKKRSSRITETFDPTAILTWLYKKDNTTVNTSMAFRSVYYNRTALQYYKANDPNPTYYRYLPSYYKP